MAGQDEKQDNEETKEVKTDLPNKDVDRIDTSAASPNKSSASTPGSPSVSDFKYEYRKDI